MVPGNWFSQKAQNGTEWHARMADRWMRGRLAPRHASLRTQRVPGTHSGAGIDHLRLSGASDRLQLISLCAGERGHNEVQPFLQVEHRAYPPLVASMRRGSRSVDLLRRK